MDDWTRRLIEAVLDPKGKWYDAAGRDRLLTAAPELERIPDEPAAPSRPTDAEPSVTHTAPFPGMDEWDPA